jgi:uncharacterized integral membrane protein
MDHCGANGVAVGKLPVTAAALCRVGKQEIRLSRADRWEGNMSSGEGPFDQTDSVDPVGSGAETETVAETGGARFARKAHRTLLYLYAGVAVVLLVCLIALVLANTGHVRVSWVFGASSVSLVWLVIFAALLGLLLGMVLGALFHWRTRGPRD